MQSPARQRRRRKGTSPRATPGSAQTPLMDDSGSPREAVDAFLAVAGIVEATMAERAREQVHVLEDQLAAEKAKNTELERKLRAATARVADGTIH